MNYTYQNPSVTPMERTLNLLSLMTLEEKIGQMMQISYNMVDQTEAEEWVSKKFSGSFLHVLGDNADHLQELALSTRLGIPLIFGIDAIHGHGLLNGATIFPSQLAMSCSFNISLIEKAGRVTAREVAADGLHWTFSPVLCIGRDIRWGRIAETFGEDPYLIGELASAIIKGYQGGNLSDPDSILACAKHYLAYGESTGAKDAYDTEVTVRKVREVFLPPFKKAVEVGCATFMTGYQAIDGTPMTANKKMLKGLLKDELGFEGFVVTDWNNTGSLVSKQRVSPDIFDAARKTVESGNDMIMNTNDFYEATLEQVKSGKISESLIDEAVKRILNIKFTMGLFDGKRKSGYIPKDVIACKEHEEINLQLTRESMVLLENKNKTLPLKNIKKTAVIGPNADDIQAQFGDWTFFSHPNPNPDAVPNFEYYTMLRGIQELAGTKNVEVSYNKGCHIMNKEDIDVEAAACACEDADVIIAVVGDCLALNGEFKDRATLDMPGAQQRLLEELKKLGKPLVVVLVNGKPLSIPWITENADAVIETFNSGTLGGKALAEIVFGEFNPCGKLTISFPYHSGQMPVYYNHLAGWHSPKYSDMPVADPLYSFGYGLSYTSYKYSNLRLSKTICSIEDTITVSVDVTNVGEYDGTEIVQLYINDIISSIMTPVKELKGFERVYVKAGQTNTVNINLSIADLTLVNADEQYSVEPGDFEIMVGSDSRNQSQLKEILRVQ